MRTFAAIALMLLALSATVEAGTIPFSGNFRHDVTVTIEASGIRAVMKQDPDRAAPYRVALINDPSAGDPVVLTRGLTLLFDYDLGQESAGNSEDFLAVLLEGGSPVGAPYEFKDYMPSSGTVAWNLPSTGAKPLGIAFYMRVHLDDGSEPSSAYLVVENLRLVPLPSAALAGLGLFASLLAARVLRRRRT